MILDFNKFLKTFRVNRPATTERQSLHLTDMDGFEYLENNDDWVRLKLFVKEGQCKHTNDTKLHVLAYLGFHLNLSIFYRTWTT